VKLDAFPLTPNKKVDRKELPAPTLGAAKAQPKATPPAAPAIPVNLGSEADISDKIAAIWSATLGVQQIGPKDSFFDLGGHSLLAVQVHREIRARLGVQKLSITDIFRAPTLGALSKIVAQKAGAPAAATVPKTDKMPKPAMATAEATHAPDDPLQDAMARRREMRERRRNR